MSEIFKSGFDRKASYIPEATIETSLIVNLHISHLVTEEIFKKLQPFGRRAFNLESSSPTGVKNCGARRPLTNNNQKPEAQSLLQRNPLLLETLM